MKTINVIAGVPGGLNLDLYRDRDFSLTVQLFDRTTGNTLTITGWTGEAQIRSSKEHPVAPAPDNLIGDFVVNVFESLGKVVISMTDTVVNALDFDPGEEAFWDLILIDDSGKRWPYLEGKVSMHETVTRS